MLDFSKQLYAKDYRREAHQQCGKYMGDLILVHVIYLIACSVASGTGLGLFVIPHLTIGYIIAIKNVHINKKPQIENLFEAFNNDYLKKLLIYILQGLYLFLWACIPFVGLIIIMVKDYSYSMTYYIHLDNPELSANDCITKSREMMKGHKWELFCLEFSYIGWMFLSMFTFGILLLWVTPRMNYAFYLFYLKVSGRGLQKDEEVIVDFTENNNEAPSKEDASSVKEDDFFAEIDSKFN